nr:hypothetical protein [uncultured bacterium]
MQEVTGTKLQTKSINGKGEEVDENLLADTRTFIYKEVLFSSIKNDYWLYGRSPARGNDTVYFSDMDMVENRSERLRNEVGILNVFTWTGLIGVFLYFLIFYKASYLAINNSNNSLSKFIGVYISFRWFNSWVAEISNFDLINFTIWLAVALCFSKTFRSMTDSELKSWVKGITNKRMKKI